MAKQGVGLVLSGIAAVVILWGARGYSDTAAKEPMSVPMGTIVLKAPEDVESKRSPVEFPHTKHFDTSCVVCHHTWGLTEPIVGCTTSGCHDLTELPKKKPGEKVDEEAVMAYFKTAYHKMCIGCHKEAKLKRDALERSLQTEKSPLPKVGPTTCAGCHPKEG
jgi:hypothetical protein